MADFCTAVLTASAWAESELVRGYWECYSAEGGETPGYNLFSMVRGRGSAAVGEIRLKVTIEDETVGQEAKNALIRLARSVSEVVGLPVEAIPDSLLDDSGTKERKLAGARITVREEGGTGSSYNLIILLPPPSPSFATMTFEYMSRLPGRVASPAPRP